MAFQEMNFDDVLRKAANVIFKDTGVNDSKVPLFLYLSFCAHTC